MYNKFIPILYIIMFFLPCGWLLSPAVQMCVRLFFSFHYPVFDFEWSKDERMRLGMGLWILPTHVWFVLLSSVFLGGRHHRRILSSHTIVGLIGLLCVSNTYTYINIINLPIHKIYNMYILLFNMWLIVCLPTLKMCGDALYSLT